MKIINYDFKILYFFGILFVVMGHCDATNNFLFNWFPFHTFHLGLFVFCSGYFFSFKGESCIYQILSKFKKLVIPMYLWNIVYGLFVIFLNKYGFTIGGQFTLYNLLLEPIKTGHQFIWNLGTWFVIPLFIVEVIHILVSRLFKIEKYINSVVI